MLNPADFKRNIQAVDSLGTTPAILVKVTELARDPNADIASLCELLRKDGPLAADIIRISNSPVYAPTTLHSNLASAVNYIGMREVICVVNLALSRRLFARDLPRCGLNNLNCDCFLATRQASRAWAQVRSIFSTRCGGTLVARLYSRRHSRTLAASSDSGAKPACSHSELRSPTLPAVNRRCAWPLSQANCSAR